jgi:hypothetical protein
LAILISRISSRISSGTVGRPPRCLDFQRQYDLTGSPLCDVALRRHTLTEALARLRRTVRAKRARAAEMSPAARALRSDVVRRAASRGGTLRYAEARRVAYRDVDKSYASHRLT